MTQNKPKFNIIDPHVHLFDLSQGHYHWLKAKNPPFWSDKSLLERNFSESDMLLTAPCQLAGFVHIEAGFDNQQPARELAWLEQHCQLPFRTIAFLDLLLPTSTVIEQLALLGNHRSFVGCRYILDGHAQENLAHQLLTQSALIENLAILAQADLLFECQMSLNNPAAVTALVELLIQLPQLKVIINHAGFAPTNTAASAWQLWLQGLAKLSKFPNVAIKCSGLELLDRHYHQAWQQEIILALLYFFGEQRVMCASNFPLCLLSHSYQQVWHQIQQLAVTSQTLSNLSYHNAVTWYRFNAATNQ
jgi:L-fuconolactonase